MCECVARVIIDLIACVYMVIHRGAEYNMDWQKRAVDQLPWWREGGRHGALKLPAAWEASWPARLVISRHFRMKHTHCSGPRTCNSSVRLTVPGRHVTPRYRGLLTPFNAPLVSGNQDPRQQGLHYFLIMMAAPIIPPAKAMPIPTTVKP